MTRCQCLRPDELRPNAGRLGARVTLRPGDYIYLGLDDTPLWTLGIFVYDNRTPEGGHYIPYQYNATSGGRTRAIVVRFRLGYLSFVGPRGWESFWQVPDGWSKVDISFGGPDWHVLNANLVSDVEHAGAVDCASVANPDGPSVCRASDAGGGGDDATLPDPVYIIGGLLAVGGLLVVGRITGYIK